MMLFLRLPRAALGASLLALAAVAPGCEPENGQDAGTFEAGVEGPGDAGLDAARDEPVLPPSDATADAPLADSAGPTAGLDAGGDAHVADATASDASRDASVPDGASAPEASASAPDAGVSDAAVIDASAVDAARPDAATSDGGSSTSPGSNASVTRFEETGRTCHTLSPNNATQRWNCQAELCGPALVQLELTASQGGAFDVPDCPSSDPNHYAYTTPYVLILRADENRMVVVTFDSTLRDVPLTVANLQAKVVKGLVAYNGTHATRPATALPTWADQIFDAPVQIVDYRDGVLHLKIEADHPSLAYADFREHVCEGPVLPIQTCSELYCNYSPGSGAGQQARHLEAHFIGKFSTQCPAQP